MYKVVNRKKLRSLRKMKFWRRRLSDLTRPRLCVFRSTKHMQAQVIDDASGKVLVSANSVEKVLRGKKAGVELAQLVGKTVAERAIQAGLKSVVFDRNGFTYHGRIKALADSAREAGLDF